MAEEAFGGGAPRPEPGAQGPANGSRPPPAKRPAAAASGSANAGVTPPRAGGRIEKGFDTFLQSQKVHEPSVSPVGAPISVPNTPDERSPTPGPHRDEDSRRPERRRSQTTSFEPKDRAPRPHQPQPQSQSQLVQKFVLKDERKGSSAVLVLLGLIVAVAVGVILYSFKVI